MPLWKQMVYVLPEKFNEHYANFCKDNNIQPKNQAGAIIMNRAIEDYCKHFDIIFNKQDKNRLDARCRSFRTTSTSEQQPDDTPF
jgi:hypothetical protein